MLAFVGPTAEVMFEGAPYSMPPSTANVPGTAFVYEDRIRIIAGRHEAEHRRRKPGEPPAVLPEHRAAENAAVHGGRARSYEMRQQVLQLGSDALTLLTTTVYRDPMQARARMEALHALLTEHGDEALRAALQHAMTHGDLTVAAVRDALQHGPRS